MKRILILGSKGKTTTASALSNALSKLGLNTIFTEGLGYSAFHILSELENDNMHYDAVIIEMSQWQIRDTAEALGYHWPRIDIIGVTDTIPIPRSFSDKTSEGGIIIGPWAQKIIIPKDLREKLLYSGIIPRAKIKAFPSLLNPFRYRIGPELAWECLRALGYGMREAKEAFRGYKGIPNRLELIGVRNGISFINDSSSVLPISVKFSMSRMQGTPVHLIVGGTDKSKISIEELEDPLDDAVSVTLLSGSLTDKIALYLRQNGIRYTGPFDKVEDAVDAAYKAALEHQRGRDASEIILLSPGGYADEFFANEYERGKNFRIYSRKLISAQP